MTTIGAVPGIDPRSATRLRKAGIKTAKAFTQRTQDQRQVQLLSELTGIDRGTLIEIADSIGLMALEGLGSQYCGLLKATGINAVAVLGACSPEEVLEQMEVANHQIRMVKRLPSLDFVRSWVQQAQEAHRGNAPG